MTNPIDSSTPVSFTMTPMVVRTCPRDGATLTPHAQGRLQDAWTCPVCGALWIDHKNGQPLQKLGD